MTPAEMPTPYAGPPLRVAWVGNYRHPWCSEMHFTQSVESLGHHVERWQEDELDWSTVVPMVERLGLQAVFWTRTWPAEMKIVLPVLEELRERGIVSAAVHLDRWFGLDRAHQVDDQPFFRTSVVVSPDDSPKWAEHGVNHFWLPPGVYGPECEPVPPNPRRWPYDVVFVGSHPYPHPEWAKYRSDLLAAFSRAFRGRFGILPRRGVPIRGRDLQELYATVPVVLGDSCLAGESHRYWSDRVPETLGRGGLLIHPEVTGMGSWYSGQRWEHGSGDGNPYAEGLTWPPNSYGDLLTYKLGDFPVAVASAKWALAHPDSAAVVRANGRATVLARDTYAHRMGTVLAVAEGIHGGYRDVEWERASPEVEREAGVSFSARMGPLPPLPESAYPPGAVPIPVEYAPLRVKLNRWYSVIEPRPGTTD
jgi:hypothetical protein